MAEPIRRVVLVGFMGSGKTTVGKVLAECFGWRHVDLDACIERRAGFDIPEIFARRGHAYFRGLEAEASERLAGCERTVLSPGGGWMLQPGLLASLGPGSLTVWLRVSADQVVRRLAHDPGRRPLLDVSDPARRVRQLLRRREHVYEQADFAVDTDGRDSAEVARIVEREVRRRLTVPKNRLTE